MRFGLPSCRSESRFRDLGEIARGGMGTVRRVYDTVLRREVAMKVCETSDPAYAQTVLRLMEEAQITGQLDHPNIVRRSRSRDGRWATAASSSR